MGEASLFGHLKNGDDEEKGSDAYVPPDRDKDTQLEAAVEFLHGAKPEALRSPDSAATVTSK
jgi:carboxyl-terminal processing protease